MVKFSFELEIRYSLNRKVHTQSLQIFQIDRLTIFLVKWPQKPETLTRLVPCDKLATLQACVIINN